MTEMKDNSMGNNPWSLLLQSLVDVEGANTTITIKESIVGECVAACKTSSGQRKGEG